MWIFNAITIFVILYYPINNWMRFFVLLFLPCNILFTTKRPPLLKKIKCTGEKWFLEIDENTNESYTHAAILLHNPIFQLVKFKNKSKIKTIVIFNDQLTKDQLRLLHLKTNQISI